MSDAPRKSEGSPVPQIEMQYQKAVKEISKLVSLNNAAKK